MLTAKHWCESKANQLNGKETGKIMQKDDLRRKAEQGDAASQFDYGYTFLMENDLANAVKWLNMAADNMNHGAMATLTQVYPHYYNSSNSNQVVDRLVKFAEAGNPAAKVVLGRMLVGAETSKQNEYIGTFGDCSSYINELLKSSGKSMAFPSMAEFGLELIKQGVLENGVKKMNCLDGSHFYGAFMAFRLHGRKVPSERLNLALFALIFIRAGIKYGVNTNAPNDFIEMCRELEKVTIEELDSQAINWKEAESVFWE